MRDFLAERLGSLFAAELILRAATFAVEIVLAYALWRLCRSGVERYRRRNPDSPRSETIAALVGSTVKYLIYFFTLVAALDTLFDVNVISILAAAGVVGVALAFGAQSVVKDVITGFFIIFEGEFEVGDLVTIDGFTGTVTSITLRCTTLKSYIGDVYIIPNGSVETVLNHQKEGRGLPLEVSIAYESDVDRAISLMERCCAEAARDMDEITGPGEVHGVVAMNESGVRLRVLVPCVPGGQFAAERELLRRVKHAFDENGVELYHKTVIDLGNEDKIR